MHSKGICQYDPTPKHLSVLILLWSVSFKNRASRRSLVKTKPPNYT